MTKFNVMLSKSSVKFLNSLDNVSKNRIKNALQELCSDPFNPRPKVDIKKLHKISKHEFYRLRVGNYRVVYVVENAEIKVTAIFSREKGYEWLE